MDYDDLELFKEKKNHHQNNADSVMEHTLNGTIKRIVYKSPDETFSVIRLVDNRGVEHTVTGPLLGAQEGQEIEVTGPFTTHKDYGRQLNAKHFKYTLPKSTDGIKRYLASGIIEGLGPVGAGRIVDKFGLDTLSILDNETERLNEVKGIGRKLIHSIRKHWHSHNDQRNIYIFLQGLGISPAYCQRIYKAYGDNAPAIVKNNPYQLSDDIRGIGFINCDHIAKSLGIEKNDEKRLEAGISYALKKLNGAGHTCFPENEFITYTQELLEVELPYIHKGLERALKYKRIYIETYNNTRFIYASNMWRLEQKLPVLLNDLLKCKKHRGKKTANVELDTLITLNKEQKQAVDNLANYPISIITGGPGVGKTTVISEIVRRANKANLKTYLCAPTGRAAKRLSESAKKMAMTIHRMLKWDPEKQEFVFNEEKKMKCDVLIVDEVSMLDISLSVHLFAAINNGTTVILVGDADQLPSVGPGNVLHDLIESQKIPVTHLCQIYRQGAGSEIINNAAKINQGILPNLQPGNKNVLSDFYWIEQDNPEIVVDKITEMVKNRIPQRFGFNPMQEIQVLAPMKQGDCGTKNLNKMLQKMLNPDTNCPQIKLGESTFKPGDRVMQIRNNYEKNVFNGDMGHILSINTKTKEFTVLFDNRKVKYEFIEIDQLSLAYAITIHKSQGSEFPAVIIPFLTQHYMMLQRNLLYTAITRAKKLLILIGTKKAVSLAVRNATKPPRYTLLKERLKAIK